MNVRTRDCWFRELSCSWSHNLHVLELEFETDLNQSPWMYFVHYIMYTLNCLFCIFFPLLTYFIFEIKTSLRHDTLVLSEIII